MTADGIDLGAVEQAAGAFGIGAHEGAVTNLVFEEGLVIAGGGFAIHLEGVLALRLTAGIVAEQIPVAALHGFFHLDIGIDHAAADAVIDAGGVGDDGVTGRLCVIGAELKEDALTSLFHLN